jgi:uncharacterized protein (DUF1015 family)
MQRNKKMSKRTFAMEIEKSPRTVERWIATGIIPNTCVFRDPTGHIFIHERALDHIYTSRRQLGGRYA